jgi:hypothetical protein
MEDEAQSVLLGAFLEFIHCLTIEADLLYQLEKFPHHQG